MEYRGFQRFRKGKVGRMEWNGRMGYRKGWGMGHVETWCKRTYFAMQFI